MKPITAMKSIKILLLAALSGLAVTSCNMQPSGEAADADTPVEARVQPVKIHPLQYTETAVEQKITATVFAFEETYLSPALQGRIRSVKVEVNDHVNKGDLVVEMDRTQLDQTRLQYQNLKTDLERMDTLLQYGSVTQQSYDQMKSQVEITELVLKNLEENTLLRAPHSGIITGKYYNDGELFSPTPNTPVGKAALVSMVQIDPVKVMVNLGEEFLPQVSKGMSAAVSSDVYPGRQFAGGVFRIHPTVNAATRTFTIEIKVSNPGELLRPGMFARVHLKLGMKNALLVPSISVLQTAGTNERYVMLYENGQAKKVVVRILDRYDDRLEISSPEIAGGEQLIYAGHTNLEDGGPVKVVTD